MHYKHGRTSTPILPSKTHTIGDLLSHLSHVEWRYTSRVCVSSCTLLECACHLVHFLSVRVILVQDPRHSSSAKIEKHESFAAPLRIAHQKHARCPCWTIPSAEDLSKALIEDNSTLPTNMLDGQPAFASPSFPVPVSARFIIICLCLSIPSSAARFVNDTLE